MSLIHPGIDSGHIKQQALRARNLGSLSREEDAFRAMHTQGKIEITQPVVTTPFDRVIYDKKTIEEIKDFCKDKAPDEIHEAMHTKVFHLSNGKKVLSRYGWINQAYSFKSAGIDEEALLKDVVAILGDCNLTGSELKSLGEVENIHGRLTVPYFTKLQDLSSLKSVGAIKATTENVQDTIELLKRLNFNPKEILFEGVCQDSRYISLALLQGIKTQAAEALKSLAASKIY
ncbi:MAG: hypothetical protein IJ877_00875 [Candidatus Gastranaerophilales bacterium]|nr:hypothetical protein [Candidatus Gastranaerophilales bacterium]